MRMRPYQQQALSNGSAANDMQAVLSDAAESLRWMIENCQYPNEQEYKKAVETLEKIDWLLKS